LGRCAGCRDEGHRREVFETAALAAQFLALADGDRAFDVVLAVRTGVDHAALVLPEGAAVPAACGEHTIHRFGKRAAFGNQRQPQMGRHPWILRQMAEPRSDDGVGVAAVDERGAERGERMGPAGKPWIQTTPAFDARRE
jgi:hypothetical protein